MVTWDWLRKAARLDVHHKENRGFSLGPRDEALYRRAAPDFAGPSLAPLSTILGQSLPSFAAPAFRPGGHLRSEIAHLLTIQGLGRAVECVSFQATNPGPCTSHRSLVARCLSCVLMSVALAVMTFQTAVRTAPNCGFQVTWACISR